MLTFASISTIVHELKNNPVTIDARKGPAVTIGRKYRQGEAQGPEGVIVRYLRFIRQDGSRHRLLEVESEDSRVGLEWVEAFFEAFAPYVQRDLGMDSTQRFSLECDVNWSPMIPGFIPPSAEPTDEEMGAWLS